MFNSRMLLQDPGDVGVLRGTEGEQRRRWRRVGFVGTAAAAAGHFTLSAVASQNLGLCWRYVGTTHGH